MDKFIETYVMKPKVAIIFPKYAPNDSSHYPYWYKVFNQASKALDLCVVFETPNKILKGNRHKEANEFGLHTIHQHTTLKPFNLFDRFFILLKLRFQGYSHFYIHYSIWSLLISKVITTLFGGTTYLWDCEYYEKTIPNKLLVQALKWTDVIVTGHQKIADQYKKILNLPNKNIKVVRNWVIDKKHEEVNRINKKQYKIQNTIFNILFIHHLSPRKGTRELPAIIKQVTKKIQNVHFTIVGDGPDYDWLKIKLKQQFNHLTIQQFNNLVTLTGSLPKKEVDKLWHHADLFIMPSRAEGFPRVVLEAQKYGVPYVATDVGCVREISPQDQQKYIVSLTELNIFPDRICDLIELNISNCKKLKESNLLNSQKYTLDKTVNKYIQLFI